MQQLAGWLVEPVQILPPPDRLQLVEPHCLRFEVTESLRVTQAFYLRWTVHLYLQVGQRWWESQAVYLQLAAYVVVPQQVVVELPEAPWLAHRVLRFNIFSLPVPACAWRITALKSWLSISSNWRRNTSIPWD